MADIKAPETGRIWELYQNGLDAHSSINLLNTIAENERFFAGDQWHGIVAPDLPKPQINFIQKAVEFKSSSISNTKPKVEFVANQVPSDVVTPDAIDQNNQQVLNKAQYLQQAQQDPNAMPQDISLIASEADAQLLSAVFELDWERYRGRDLCDRGLVDACISGNMILYNFWNSKVKNNQIAEGAIDVRLIDNVNFFPTDMQESNIQLQPSIIVSQRELVSKVKAEAKLYGAKPDDLQKISDDSENYNNAGDMSRKEVQDTDAYKVTTLMYFWRDAETGKIYAVKTSHNVVIRPAWDTLLTRYPFAAMSWKYRKNSFYGRSEIEGLIPNQRSLNKALAMMLLSVTNTAWPRVLYSQGMIQKWTNNISEAIPVNGDINNAAKYLQPPSMSNDAFQLPELLMKNSLEMMGVGEAVTGNGQVYNASANALAVNQSQTPVSATMRRFYSMLEDFAENWRDMVFGYINAPRWVFPHDNQGNSFPMQLDPEQLRQRAWNVSVEVGQAPEFSYSVLLNQMAQWVQSGQMQLEDYIDSVDESIMPNKQKILSNIRQRQQQIQQQAMQMAQQQIQQKMGAAPQQPQQVQQMGGQQ